MSLYGSKVFCDRRNFRRKNIAENNEIQEIVNGMPFRKLQFITQLVKFDKRPGSKHFIDKALPVYNKTNQMRNSSKKFWEDQKSTDCTVRKNRFSCITISQNEDEF